jgi:hypothetical protein
MWYLSIAKCSSPALSISDRHPVAGQADVAEVRRAGAVDLGVDRALVVVA